MEHEDKSLLHAALTTTTAAAPAPTPTPAPAPAPAHGSSGSALEPRPARAPTPLHKHKAVSDATAASTVVSDRVALDLLQDATDDASSGRAPLAHRRSSVALHAQGASASSDRAPPEPQDADLAPLVWRRSRVALGLLQDATDDRGSLARRPKAAYVRAPLTRRRSSVALHAQGASASTAGSDRAPPEPQDAAPLVWRRSSAALDLMKEAIDDHGSLAGRPKAAYVRAPLAHRSSSSSSSGGVAIHTQGSFNCASLARRNNNGVSLHTQGVSDPDPLDSSTGPRGAFVPVLLSDVADGPAAPGDRPRARPSTAVLVVADALSLGYPIALDTVDVYDTVARVKMLLEDSPHAEGKLPAATTEVIYNGVKMDNDKKLIEYKLPAQGILVNAISSSTPFDDEVEFAEMRATLVGSEVAPPKKASDEVMTLTLVMPGQGGQTAVLEVGGADTVHDLRRIVAGHFQLPDEYFITHAHRMMDDDERSLASYHVKHGDVLTIISSP